MRYAPGGFLVILPGDDPDRIVDVMIETGYCEEFCVAPDMSPGFLAALMGAGFLIMSSRFGASGEAVESFDDRGGFYLALPKLHLSRSVLFFKDLHVRKSARRLLNDGLRLCFDVRFDEIVDRCVKVHGDGWLTPPLTAAIREIRLKRIGGVRPASFALYRGDRLVAGEFGVIVGGVYTSYSGFHDENGCGTAQLVLTARWLRDNGFAFLDFGMPLAYKTDLGAADVSPGEFVRLFRDAR